MTGGSNLPAGPSNITFYGCAKYSAENRYTNGVMVGSVDGRGIVFETLTALEPRYPATPLPLRAVSRLAVGDGGRVLPGGAQITSNNLYGTFYNPDEAFSMPLRPSLDFIVGANGTILNGPTKTMISPTTKTLMAVDGVIGYHAQAWAVGADSEIIHWTGTQWEPGNHPAETGVTLRGISVFSATDAWAVGDGGRALHWNGTSWTAFPTGATVTLHAIMHRPPDPGFPPFFWAVGENGTVLKWNGFVWAAQSAPSSEPLYAVCFLDEQRGLVVGGRGGAFTSSATVDSWTPYPVNLVTSSATSAIGAASGTDVWVALNAKPSPSPSSTPTTAGQAASRLFHRVNDVWTTFSTFDTPAVRSILPLPGGAAFFSGAGLYWNGTTLETPDVYFISTTHLWGTAIDDLWLVGDNATAALHRSAIGTTSPAGPTGIPIVDVWGNSSNDLWAISDYALWYWNGTSWMERPLTMAGGTFGKWQLVRTTPGAVWVLAQTSVFKWNGTALTVLTNPVAGQDPTRVSFYPLSDNAVWVSGPSGAYRWNGTTWDQRSSAAILSMSGTPERVWAVTQDTVLDFAP